MSNSKGINKHKSIGYPNEVWRLHLSAVDKICQIFKIWHIYGLLLICSVSLQAQNPHGDNLKMDCKACHTSDGWEIALERWNFEDNPKIERSKMTGLPLGLDTAKFNHYNTMFPLNGQHQGSLG